MMKIEDIKHPELKNQISLIYMHSENQNEKAIENSEEEIRQYIKDKDFIISVEDGKPVKIPYANDGEYLVPIFTDEHEYLMGMQYFSLNVMDENKDYAVEKIKEIDDPDFLGYLINIASVSYITLP